MKSIALLEINWEVSLQKRKLHVCKAVSGRLWPFQPFQVFFVIETCNKTDFYFRIITKKTMSKKLHHQKYSSILSTIMLKPVKIVVLVYYNDNSLILHWRSESVFISEMAISKKFLCVYICYTVVSDRNSVSAPNFGRNYGYRYRSRNLFSRNRNWNVLHFFIAFWQLLY